MKLARKILTFTAIGSLAAVVIILIMAIFGLDVFTGDWLKILLTLATVTVASAVLINSTNYMQKKKIIAYISMGLTCALVVLALVILWGALSVTDTISKITLILAMATIFFNIIISINLKLEKSYIALQAVSYFLIAVIDVLLTIVILGINLFEYNGFWQGFAVGCLVLFGLLCALGILARKPKEEISKDSITISKAEYNSLLQKIEDLQAELDKKENK